MTELHCVELNIDIVMQEAMSFFVHGSGCMFSSHREAECFHIFASLYFLKFEYLTAHRSNMCVILALNHSEYDTYSKLISIVM